MKQIKILKENAAAIEAALAEVNGRAKAHTFSTYAQIAEVAEDAEVALAELLLKKDRKGARFSATSGDAVARSYKYSRTGTNIVLVREAKDWSLVEVRSAHLFCEQGGRRLLSLTPNQEAAAIKQLHTKFVTHPITTLEN